MAISIPARASPERPEQPQVASQWRRDARRFARVPTAVAGLALTVIFVLVALLADWLAPISPFKSVATPFIPPSAAYWFGTDDLGRDLYSGVVHGARTSLLIGASVAAAAFIIGALVGGCAGFFGGWVDDALMRMTELVQVLPRFFLALVVVALFGSKLTVLIAVLALTSWTFTARLARASVLSLRGQDFVSAAHALGMSHWRILARHVLPNAVAPLIVVTSFQVGRAILTEAGLSFVGLGDPNAMSWGYLLNNAQRFMRLAWWMSLFPGLAVALCSIGVNLLGEGLITVWNRQISVRGHDRV